jgi:predicted small lipoprotein YifL
MLARLAAAAAAAVIAAHAAGCGQKGPLYLRDSPPPGTKLPKPEGYTPKPYPKDSREGDGAGAAKN